MITAVKTALKEQRARQATGPNTAGVPSAQEFEYSDYGSGNERPRSRNSGRWYRRSGQIILTGI